ncbi:MAG: hypothetical protein QOE35_1782 [Actinomycetota bacterium]|jgi:hypothetical protein
MATRPLSAELGLRLPRFEVVVGGAILIAYMGVFAWAMERTTYDVWPAMLIGPLLAAITLPFMLRTARREGDDLMVRLAPTVLGVKAIGILARFVMIYGLYHGKSDATEYYGAGRSLADQFRAGDYSVDVGKFIGTGFLKIVTGIVFSITDPTKLGGFFVFGWFSFLGVYLCYRAMRVACPELDSRRYFFLLFFLPSTLFWPSSIGKEAWMVLTVGATAYGVALLLKAKPRGVLWTGAGLLGSAACRPHITLMLFVGLTAAFLLRRPVKRLPTNILVKGLGIVVLLVVGSVVIGGVAQKFNLDSFDAEGVDAALTRTQAQTSKSGSEFTAVKATNPAQAPVAIVTVLFRPFPFEAGTPLALGTAVEASFLLLLTIRGWRRIAAAIRMMVRVPYLAFVGSYTFVFCLAFGSIGNFGILARQRVQMLPLFVLLLAVPPLERKGRRRGRQGRAESDGVEEGTGEALSAPPALPVG